jgi:hypothetical protein
VDEKPKLKEAHCEYYFPVVGAILNTGKAQGHCHANPPQALALPNGLASVWPPVERNCWCGAFEKPYVSEISKKE